MSLLPFLNRRNGGSLAAYKLAKEKELLYLGYVMWWVFSIAKGNRCRAIPMRSGN